MKVHPTSVISPEAEIDSDVVIGPFCYIRGNVRIGSGTFIESHVSIGAETGRVEIGKNNRIHAGVILGGPPQDKKFRNEKSFLIIGDGNQLRESVTMSLGTGEGGRTTLGNNNLIMAYCHFGHDCHVGSENVVANSSQFAGHVEIGDRVNVGGMCAFNQFVRIGSYSFLAGYSAVNKDILPYSIAQGNYAVVRATNKIGLERSGLPPKAIEAIHKAIRIITKGSSTIAEGLARIQEECQDSAELRVLVDFIKSSKRGLAK